MLEEEEVLIWNFKKSKQSQRERCFTHQVDAVDLLRFYAKDLSLDFQKPTRAIQGLNYTLIQD